MSIAVITSVTGNYDHEMRHTYTSGVDYFYFTDGKSRSADSRWQRVMLPDLDIHPRRLAKLPKLHPHSFPEIASYDFVIWIDGSMSIEDENFPHAILSYLNGGLVLSPHFDGRDCAYGEATIRPPKYASEPLDEQVEFYRDEGFPEHYGLYEAGVHARRMNYPGLSELGELWLDQNMRFSYQDQVSLPYCLWKLQFTPDVLPQSFRNYNWVHINAHKSEL